MRVRKYFHLVISVFLLISCGKKDNKKDHDGEGKDELSLTPFEQISGNWEGSYKSLNDGKPIGEPSFAKVTFSGDNSFVFLIDGETSGRVEGNWREFQGETLILRIKGSNVPRIGSTGKLVEPLYELIGLGLRLVTATFELNLSKKADQSSEQNGGVGAPRFTGTWNCEDGSTRKTKVLIAADNTFKLSSLKPSERIFIAVGKTIAIADQSLKLVVDSTSDPIAVGSYFEMNTAGESFELILNRPGQEVIHLGQCVL